MTLGRRRFLAGTTALGALGVLGVSPALAAALSRTETTSRRRETLRSQDRLGQALEVRRQAAQFAHDLGAGDPRTNGDEDGVPRRAACYTKGLPHDSRGEVEPRAYALLLRALASGRREDLESIPLGGFVKLANPQAAWAFELVGPDASQLGLEPPPRFASEEQAAEIVELYWQALLRDVPFAEYVSSPWADKAARDLSRFGSSFKGSLHGKELTAANLFRGRTEGDVTGPYVSQFLWKPIPLLPFRLEQRMRTTAAGLDYLASFPDWLGVQNGRIAEASRFDSKPRYIRNGRDLGEYVHRDFTDQAFLGACLAALKWGTPPDGANPYKHSYTESAFATFGQPYLIYALAAVTHAALKVCWYQKWRVHRRLRPEEFAGRVENHLRRAAVYPIHESLFGSTGLEEIRRRKGSALLPQAYPEGAPTHPSYPAGHAVIAGACATVLKALLDEAYAVPEPVVASSDGLSLEPWKGETLTVGGELDKLAFNIAMGRNFAGIHWRSDAAGGLKLGEEVAIEVLRELALTDNELVAGWSLRTFEGRRVTVG